MRTANGTPTRIGARFGSQSLMNMAGGWGLGAARQVTTEELDKLLGRINALVTKIMDVADLEIEVRWRKTLPPKSPPPVPEPFE